MKDKDKLIPPPPCPDSKMAFVADSDMKSYHADILKMHLDKIKKELWRSDW